MIGTERERERFAGIFRDFRFEFFPQKKKKKKKKNFKFKIKLLIINFYFDFRLVFQRIFEKKIYFEFQFFAFQTFSQ